MIQVIMATHAPILMAYPEARLLRLTRGGLEPVTVEETEHFGLMREFVLDPGGLWRARWVAWAQAQDERNSCRGSTITHPTYAAANASIPWSQTSWPKSGARPKRVSRPGRSPISVSPGERDREAADIGQRPRRTDKGREAEQADNKWKIEWMALTGYRPMRRP